MEFKPVRRGSPKWLWIFVVVAAVGLVLPTWALLRAVTGRQRLAYELAPGEVLIHYGARPVALPRTGMAPPVVVDHPTGGHRQMGTSMPGLYQGRWSFRETGPVQLYATRLERLVLLETAGRRYLISPDDPEGFVRALSAGETGRWAPAPGASPWPLTVGLLGLIVVTLIPAVGVLLYYIRLPESIRYVLTESAVLIEGGRLHLALPYGEITWVEFRSPRGGPWRIFGAEVPGLLWGRFSWKDAGPNLRIYATQRKPLVLIVSGGATYGISPEDGEQFVAELERRRGRPI